MLVSLKPTTRRVVQALAYEGIALCVVGSALGATFDQSATSSFSLALVLSLIALAWNFLFNTWFERWELRQQNKERTWLRRVAHACGFEGGLVVWMVPLMAYWLNTSLLHAFLADLALLGFFLVYTLVFTWVFDQIFGEPAQSRP